MNCNPIVIFRITNMCNLNCTYCYDKENHSNKLIENKKIINNMENIISYFDKLFTNKDAKKVIIFHGGEPLMININTYSILLEKITNKFKNVRFEMQTNGTLLNQEYIDLFKKYNISLGISLDGYNEASNAQRIYSSGKNSFEKVFSKIKLLNDNKYNYGIIFTLTKSIIGHEKELYEFIAKNNLKCNIRPAFGNNKNIIMTAEEYYIFFRNLFEIWLQETESVKINQISEIYEEFLKEVDKTYKSKSCISSDSCFKDFISLDIDGNLYGCNRNYNNKELYWGNLNYDTVDYINTKISKKVEERKNSIMISKCRNCVVFDECQGRVSC